MSHCLNQFRSAVLGSSPLQVDAQALQLSAEGRFATYYAPFEHINPQARVVLLGITPGRSQAETALSALRKALNDGMKGDAALAAAKNTASFSGPMRTNLVKLLDAVGVQRVIGIASCDTLFGSRSDLVHFTSSLRYPVFIDGKNYSGSPSILQIPYLRNMVDTWLREEALQLPHAIWVPLGREPSAVLDNLVAEGVLAHSRVLKGLPHPSGANAERIAYFLGRKNKADLSAKTNSDALDESRARLVEQVSRLSAAFSESATSPKASLQTLQKRPEDEHKATIKGSTHKIVLAEQLLADCLVRIRSGNKKMAGFQTRHGRHLALERGTRKINIWTEDIPSPTSLGTFEHYAASRPRHSNLAAQANRVAHGRSAKRWQFEDGDSIKALLDWYVNV